MERFLFDTFTHECESALRLIGVNGFSNGEFELDGFVGIGISETFFEEGHEVSAARLHGFETFICNDVVCIEFENAFERADFVDG